MKTLFLRLTTASAACAMLLLISCQDLPIDPWDPGDGGGGGRDTTWHGGGDTTWHGGGDTTWHGGGDTTWNGDCDSNWVGDTVIIGDSVIIIRR